MKRLGAVGNKRKDSRSDMSDFWHKYMDPRNEMMVSSGIKTRGSRDDRNAVKCTDCSRKMRSCKGSRRDMGEWRSNKVITGQDISAVWFTLLRKISRAL